VTSFPDTTTSSLRLDQLIDGEPVPSTRVIEVRDPASPGELVGTVAAADPDLSRRAVAAAAQAFGAWSRLEATERAQYLRKSLEPVAANAPALAGILTRENGKILPESLIDLAVFGARCRAAADLADGFEPSYTLPDGPFRTRIHRLPAGVVTIIVPFNWPPAILAASLPYALVAGNTVVVKPPPTAPLALTRALGLMAAQLPPGVLNVVNGEAAGVEPLISDPRVQHVVFTGSTRAGRAVMTSAAKSLAKVTLELGGNDPAVLLEDVRFDQATVDSLLGAAFMSTGQVCMAVKRVYVPRHRYGEAVEAFGHHLAAYRVGPGRSGTSTMGPLNTAGQRDRVAQMLYQAGASGAEVREYGELDPEADGDGHYLRPSLVLDPSPELTLVTEEQFGPTLPILPYDGLDPLLDQLNGEWAGLCSSVWSPDLDRARSVAARMRVGTTWINSANASANDDRAPFGGFRQSGTGRELGVDGLLEFVESHVVTEPRA
jgi:acyl-CoA reductase-like NAD-dependent aldehyde dehydrogenase